MGITPLKKQRSRPFGRLLLVLASDVQYPGGDAPLVRELYDGEAGAAAQPGAARVYHGELAEVVYPRYVRVAVEHEPGPGKVRGVEQRVNGVLHGVGVAVGGEDLGRAQQEAHAVRLS